MSTAVRSKTSLFSFISSCTPAITSVRSKTSLFYFISSSTPAITLRTLMVAFLSGSSINSSIIYEMSNSSTSYVSKNTSSTTATLCNSA
jgi:hypothetical protein